MVPALLNTRIFQALVENLNVCQDMNSGTTKPPFLFSEDLTLLSALHRDDWATVVYKNLNAFRFVLS